MAIVDSTEQQSAEVGSISQLTDELYALIDCFDAADVPYAVCGGLAVAFHGYPRATRDIDLMIRKESLDIATTAIESIGYTVPGGLIPFGVGTPEAREVFRVSRVLDEELFTLDLILVTPVFEDVWNTRIQLELNGRIISIVSRDGLAKMKRLAGRMRDLTDLDELGIADEEA